MAKDTKKENPLLSKNIPRPPETTGIEKESDNGITVTEQNSKRVERQERREPVYTTSQTERATFELSLYLKPSQDDKLEELKREYKRQTRKKISSNEIMRKLIEKATIEDLL